MANSTTIKTRLCIISDTHTSTPHPPQQTSYAFRYPLPSANILVHSGDLTKVGYIVEHETTISMLKVADAELKLVIAGNHDISLDEAYFTSFGYLRHGRPERLGGQAILLEKESAPHDNQRDAIRTPLEARKEYVARARDLYTNEEARAAGIRYLEEGVHTFTLSSGAKLTVYASPFQPEFCRWAFAYPRTTDRFNPVLIPGLPQPLNPVPDHPSIDLLLTHGPPSGILDEVSGDTHVGCKHLLRAAERARPRIHVFGHIHEAYGAARGVWDSFAEGGVRLESVGWDQEEVLEKRGAFYDVSGESEKPLRFGDETLFVNASVNTVGYEARNAPWVVDLDLPVADDSSYMKV